MQENTSYLKDTGSSNYKKKPTQEYIKLHCTVIIHDWNHQPSQLFINKILLFINKILLFISTLLRCIPYINTAYKMLSKF